MPVMWKCPGQPTCRKIFLYARGLKAHIPSCKHARKNEVKQKRHEVETMLSIILFVEDQQKGNVTVSRRSVPSFRGNRPVFSRLPEEGKPSCLSLNKVGHQVLEERQVVSSSFIVKSTYQSDYGANKVPTTMHYSRDTRRPLPNIMAVSSSSLSRSNCVIQSYEKYARNVF